MLASYHSTMALHPMVGHEAERERVLRALTMGRLPQMILLCGPRGVGKQRFGLWLAQAILCEASADRPCGKCRACNQVLGLAHPDLHWVMPLPRPKAAELDRQIEELEAGIAETLEERRNRPLYLPADGMAGHFVATARLLQRRAAMTPATGRTKVFLLAQADRLVPQEASPEAANALLKLLEEPTPDSQFLLTVEDPNRLLPTIRSRVVPLRLGRLGNDVVERFLAHYAGLSGNDLRARVALARGSIGRALAWSGREDKAAGAAEELLEAVARGPASRAERALKQGTWAARGDFTAMLDALAESLAAAARSAAGEAPGRPLPESLRRPRPIEALLEAQARVAAAREAAQGNVSPQLLLAALSDELAEVL